MNFYFSFQISQQNQNVKYSIYLAQRKQILFKITYQIIIKQDNIKLGCLNDDHKDEIETVCYNKFCTEFRLNCFKCIKKGIHHEHLEDVEKTNSLMEFIENKNKECDKLIEVLNSQVECELIILKIKRGIRNEYSFLQERLTNLHSQQINDVLSSIIKLTEYKQSITKSINDQTKKTQILLIIYMINYNIKLNTIKSLNYYQINTYNLKKFKELYDKVINYIGRININKLLKFRLIYLIRSQQLFSYMEQRCVFINEKGRENKIQDNKCLNMKQLLIQLSIRFQNKYEEAIIWLDKALAIDPKRTSSLHEEGICLRLQNKYKEAIYCLGKAQVINSTHVSSLSNKGDCL